MESWKNKWKSTFKKTPQRDTKTIDNSQPKDFASISFQKRKRKNFEDEFENALTNGRSTIFDTKERKNTKTNYYANPTF